MTITGRRELLAADFALSFLWAWSNVLIKIFVDAVLVYGVRELTGEFIRYAILILNMFIFAFMSKITNGGAPNPVSVLSYAFSGDFHNFLFTVGSRIPAQVFGSVYGVKLIHDTFPNISSGPRLKVDIAKGAMTEGFLTFATVVISLSLMRKSSRSFFMTTWISSVLKLSLQILGTELTGGCMNPASVMGWAFENGEYITKEHLIVYWLAPVAATLVAVWLFQTMSKKHDKDDVHKPNSGKSD